MKQFNTLRTVLLLSMLVIEGCTTIAPGFQSEDLPENRTFTAANGMTVDVTRLTTDTLPEPASATRTADGLNRLESLIQQPAGLYRLEKGDVLSFNLWAYPEITPPQVTNTNPLASGYTIDQLGNLEFPLIGNVHAEGLTLPQLTTQMSARLSQYLKHPDIQIRMLSFQGNKYVVTGQVRQGGQFILTDQPLNLYGALSQAGGVLDTGDMHQIQLTRGKDTYDLDLLALQREGQGSALEHLYIHKGDTIHVLSKENAKLYLLGESGTNKPVLLREQGMTLADVLGESEGINPGTSNPARVYVIRTNPEHNTTHIYHIDLANVSNIGLAQKFAMQANDVVYVDATGLTRWGRIVAQFLPAATSLSNLATVRIATK